MKESEHARVSESEPPKREPRENDAYLAPPLLASSSPTFAPADGVYVTVYSRILVGDSFM